MKPTLRFMSWNLLEGGNEAGATIPTASARLAHAKQLVSNLNPDFLILNEALWCNPHEHSHFDYAEYFQFPHQHGHLYDQHWGNVLLSRFPIISVKQYQIYNRSGFLAIVDTPDGKIQVGTYHPHPSRYAHHKALDYHSLLNCTNPHLPTLVGGDFNAISPEDKPDPQALAKSFERFSKNPIYDSKRFIDGGNHVFEMVERLGFRDAIPPLNRKPTMPTRLITDTTDSAMRIDHILCNTHVWIQNGWVEKTELADLSSDHYPVLVDFSF